LERAIAKPTVAPAAFLFKADRPSPSEVFWPWIDPEKALPWVEERIGLALAESQVAAIRLALMSKALVMTGGPGVGKTTIVKAILRILSAKGVKLLLCAPAGRAAKRMTEATGFEAKTIHRLRAPVTERQTFRRLVLHPLESAAFHRGVARLVGIECGVVSGVINLESSGAEAPDWRPRHDEHYHEA
jgi:hypothetical protein